MISSSDILKASIMIVDDQGSNVLLLERMLRGAGYVSIASTTDPNEVCDLHRQNRYDLILLDLQMPGMDGFQVMECLKEIETGGYLPVLVLTAQPDHKLRALKAGAKDFVSKPFDLAEVLIRVYNMLEVRLLHLETKKHNEQLESRVSERTEELTATNKQLEAFVNSIAHDLRAPLRSMQGFSEMLVEEAGATLSESSRDFANRISRSAQYMDALLQDLLAFSRVAQQQIELTSVNLETVVQSALSRLEEEIQEKNGRVEIAGPWPTVLAHEPTLGQVIFNLVSNALKFVRPDAPANIKIWTEEINLTEGNKEKSSSFPSFPFVRIWVEDKGIGIAPDHQAQIFRLFSRLHGDKFPGTGIGLAIVQKGVERMGGNVGLESTPVQGSRFWFELRKAEKI